MSEAANSLTPSRRTRIPVLPAVCAFALGIGLDHLLGEQLPGGLKFWWLACLGLLAVWSVCGRQKSASTLATGVLLLGVCSAGGFWQHLHWHVSVANDIGRYAGETPQPFDLEVVITTAPQVRLASLPRFATAWPEEDKTRLTGRVLGFYREGELLPASGTVVITVAGWADQWSVGEQVRVRGSLRRLSPPRNPASYHFAHAARRRGIRHAITCRSPEALTASTHQSTEVTPPRWNRTQHSLGLWISRLRNHVRAVFADQLSPASAGLAGALILGERDRLEDETRQFFQFSGLMHLLSISGLHVGLIGWLFFQWGRWGNLSPARLAWLTLAGMTLCLLLAEIRPPVLRAWLIGAVVVLGWRCGRGISLTHSLPVAAWILLLINPSWLFDTGAQLSFMAMFAILIGARLFPAGLGNQHSLQETDSLESPDTWWHAGRLRLQRLAWQGFLISLTITLLALPLLGWSFHRVTLAGIPATLICLPLLTVLLGLLLLLPVVAVCLPMLAPVIAVPTDFLLATLQAIATRFSEFSLLTWPAPRPPLFAVCLLYLAGGCGWILWCKRSPKTLSRKATDNSSETAASTAETPAALSPQDSTRDRLAGFAWLVPRSRAFPLLVWTLCLIPVFEGPRWARWLGYGMMECRVLSVGHGNACLLRTAGGECLLLDAGSMENGQIAADIILANLADMGVDRLAAIAISHTDADHLNAIPFLLERIPVRALWLNPVGLTPHHSGMRAIMEQVFDRETQLQILQPGDRMHVDGIDCEVVHSPSHPGEAYVSDNAASVVVEARVQGRRLLFTGDISGAGQQELMQRVSGPFDLLLAPHHGSLKDNSPEFAAWAGPHFVAVSCGFSVSREALRQNYGSPPLLFTTEGAIRFLISPQGTLTPQQWAPEQRWKPIPPSP